RAARGAAAQGGRPRRLVDPVSPRSWPRYPRRPQPQRTARLSRDRPPQGACGIARRRQRAVASGGGLAGMSGPKRLASLADVGAALRPAYDPAGHGHGIVHLGIGAFHRAHQADYTDVALAAAGGDWRILGASLRSVELADR